MSDPYKYFRLEARELIDQIGRGVLVLEKSPDLDAVQRLLRHAHTLKGAARVVKQPEIADRAHAIEDVLAPYRETAAALPADSITKLLAIVDDVSQRVAALAPPPSAPAAVRSVPEALPVVHADVVELDALLEGVLETHTHVGVMRSATTELDRARHLCDVMLAHLAASTRSGANVDKPYALAEQLRTAVTAITRTIETSIESVDRELLQIRDHAESLRLVPVERLSTILERTARDAAQALGKHVTLQMRVAGKIRLDAQLLATVQRALVQLVRNAVAHGIERDRRDKPRAGRVDIDVRRRARRVVFACRDDGAGVDLEAVRMVARRRGIDATTSLPVAELLALLMRSGISTSSAITELAGRGIGLDIVREVVSQVGGDVTIDSTAGVGTTFELVVPVSLSSVDALLVEAGGLPLLIPLDAVRATRRLADADITRTAHAESILQDGVATPYCHATVLLEKAAAPGPRPIGVLVETATGRVVIGVDRLLGSTAAVIRAVPDLAGADPLIAGASLDAAGRPQLILDPDRLVAAGRRERNLERRPAAKRQPVLVIDDSLTTRMLEQSILETAGYEVDTAVCAEDGLVAARRKRYALFLVDVEMPGMDGFTFVEQVRADATLRDIPAILVTSRSSSEDRMRGRQVGAQAYIVKSEFDQADLLARIQRMVK